MVTRKRLRSFLTGLTLYAVAAVLIGYFAVHAYSGNHGLKARQDIELEITELTRDLERLKVERGQWERRVSLLRSGSIDPDMLDERARALLEYSHPNDLILVRR